MLCFIDSSLTSLQKFHSRYAILKEINILLWDLLILINQQIKYDNYHSVGNLGTCEAALKELWFFVGGAGRINNFQLNLGYDYQEKRSKEAFKNRTGCVVVFNSIKKFHKLSIVVGGVF